ncbi:hypothetical protein BJV78DRAFT_1246780 [Lactifluus subvellereus]|nr:hypothetical protein BJV78DRAFT_1246780 [Lactifluus subvellereus]
MSRPPHAYSAAAPHNPADPVPPKSMRSARLQARLKPSHAYRASPPAISLFFWPLRP